MITEQQYKASALTLGVEVAVIKAVAEVESGGAGFSSSGEPVILFEPHIFWKELKKIDIEPLEYQYHFIPVLKNGKDTGVRERVINPAFADILYPVWGTKPYPKGTLTERNKANHLKLQRAVKINKEAAFQSCSWGKFQIMGFNWKNCMCSNLQLFINAMYKGGKTKDESEHLRLFTNYIVSVGLTDELQYKDWKGFARGYNGPLYARNDYDKKLAAAYQKFKK